MEKQGDRTTEAGEPPDRCCGSVRMKISTLRSFTAVACVAAIAGCSSDSPNDTPDVRFSVLPVPIAMLGCVEPIGATTVSYPIGEPDLDFDLVLDGSCPGNRYDQPGTPLYAVADGTVTAIDSNADGMSVVVNVNGVVGYEYYGMAAAPGLARGAAVTAGEEIGTTQGIGGVHFGVVNVGVTQSFAAPERYPARYLHADDPVRFFSDSLQTLLRSRGASAVAAADLAQDVRGALSGNWFAPDVPDDTTAIDPLVAHIEKLAAFRIDPVSGNAMIAIGMSPVAGAGCLCQVAPGSVPFAQVTPRSGAVIYQLYNSAPLIPPLSSLHGSLLVEMEDSTHLRTQLFQGVVVTDTVFTAPVEFVR